MMCLIFQLGIVCGTVAAAATAAIEKKNAKRKDEREKSLEHSTK